MAGLAERRGPAGDSFWTWRETMYRFLDRMTPDDIRAVAALAYVEMLESGFTRVGEFHYLHHAPGGAPYARSEEHTSELQSLMRISYAVFCLKKKKKINQTTNYDVIIEMQNRHNKRI